MTPTDCVRKALALLCERAGVDPADGSHEAGERVRAWYSRGWTDTGDAACPLDGPAGLWVRENSNAGDFGFRVYVGPDKVILTRHVAGVLERLTTILAAPDRSERLTVLLDLYDRHQETPATAFRRTA